jgi:hypothetical protein
MAGLETDNNSAEGPLNHFGIGARVPSDHLPVGTMNTSIGSGSPWNCGFSTTGEWGRSAPQTAPSMSGV